MKALTTMIAAILLTLASASAADAKPMPRNALAIGVATGQLTKGEVRALRMKEAQIMRFKRVALRDGRISLRERQKIKTMKKNLKQQYRIYTHNRARRF